MYKFVKGSRLFMQGTREGVDYDNVHDTFRPTMSAAPAAVDRSRGGSNGHVPPAEGDDLGRAFVLSRLRVISVHYRMLEYLADRVGTWRL